MATAHDIAQIIAMLTAAFPNFLAKRTEEEISWTSEVYFQLLGDLPPDELKAAVQECCSQPGRAFAPAIGEIRGAVMEMRRIGMGVPTAIDAWGEVQKQILECGSYRVPIFSNKMIANLVKRFGWTNLCMSENGMADRAHFIKAYEHQVEEELRADMRLPAVTKYIDQQRPRELEVSGEIKRLAGRLAK